MLPDIAATPPTIFVIFGGAGDLSWRKLTPALFNLYLDKRLAEPFAILALDRSDITDDALRKRLRSGVDRFSRRGRAAPADWTDFAKHITYVKADFGDKATYAALARRLAALEGEWSQPAVHVFYCAAPPSFFDPIAAGLAEAGLARDRERARMVVEKPLGYDLASAILLSRALTARFDESQIYRIDHYLGKETVQNILAFRFANPMFEPIWDRRYVDHVAITVAEAVGVEHRGAYYEHAGALRDMVQNHLMQLLCLVAMEPPVSFGADEIRNKKLDVLRAIRPIGRGSAGEFAVRGQYGEGWMDGTHVQAYRSEPGVAADSVTETFAALKLFVDNWRWHGVPFYLRTGKRLPQRVSEVSIRFRAVPHQSFPHEAAEDWHEATLVLGIQPIEGIVLRFQAKQPGPRLLLRPVDLHFSYRETFSVPSPDAYETLLYDVVIGDATLFMRADQVEAAWSVLMPVLDAWAASPPTDFPDYAAGTWGPASAEDLIARDRRSWLLPTRIETAEPCPDDARPSRRKLRRAG